MSAYIVNTSFHLQESLESSFVKWVRESFIPAAVKEPFFSNPLFCKLLIQVEEGTVSYAVHFRTTDLNAAQKWQAETGAGLKGEFSQDMLLHFTTFMEEIEII